MNYGGAERRKHARINGRFIVSYRIVKESDNIDISQTKNLSLGGMLLTTNKHFTAGTDLALEIRLPFDPDPIMIIGKVIESREVIKSLIYDTQLEFMSIDEKHKSVLSQTVMHYLKRSGRQ
jgi:Tfp pilus assembly protein PilZ